MTSPHFDARALDGYPVEYGVLLAALQDGTREWKDELGEVDVDALCWQPYPHGYSIGGLLLHIAEVEAYWIEEVSLGRELSPEETKRYEGIDQHAGAWPTVPREPLSFYYEILDDVRARTLRSVKELEPPETIRVTKWGTMTLRWVLSHVVGHDSYHGGQAVMLHELAKRLRGS